MHVGCLEVEEVEEGGVVHGGHGPCRGGSRGIGGEAVCEGGSGRMPGCSGGRGEFKIIRVSAGSLSRWIYIYIYVYIYIVYWN